MRFPATRSLLTAALLTATSLATSAQAGGEPFQITKQIDLPFKPTQAVITELDSDWILYAIGVDGNGNSSVFMHISTGDEKTVQFGKGTPSDIDLDMGRDLLFITGANQYTASIDAFDAFSLELIDSTTLSGLADPTSFLSVDNGVMMVAGVPQSNNGIATWRVSTNNSGDARVKLTETRPPVSTPHKISAVWVSWSDGKIFINAADRAAISALSLKKRDPQVLDWSAKGTPLPALSMTGTVGDQPDCAPYLAEDTPTSFIAASSELKDMILIEYDSFFGQFEIVARTPLRQSLAQGRRTQRHAVTGLAKEPILIDASCDQSVILIGNRNSRELGQFSQPPEFLGFEKVGTTNLDLAPEFVAVSASGMTAAIGFAGSNRIDILRVPGAVSASVTESATIIEAAPTRAITVSSASLSREIQRLLLARGYQIGTVDGIIGKQTISAIQTVLRPKGQSYDADDLAGTLEKLKAATAVTMKKK